MPFYDLATDGLMYGPTDRRIERWLVESRSTRLQIDDRRKMMKTGNDENWNLTKSKNSRRNNRNYKNGEKRKKIEKIPVANTDFLMQP